MMYTVILIAASAAIASAQATFNATTGKYTCAASNPNGAFCAGDSLKTNIIIRCHDGVGQPGNCNDNLAGYFPIGVNFAPCFQTSPTSGDAACSKNCIIEGGSGNFPGTSTLPGCTPSSQSSTSTPSSSPVSSILSSSVVATTTPSSLTSTLSASSGLSTQTVLPTGTGGSILPTNGTIPTGGSSTRVSGAPTATPVGPTAGTPTGGNTPASGATSLNTAGMGLAFLGFMAAYFL